MRRIQVPHRRELDKATCVAEKNPHSLNGSDVGAFTIARHASTRPHQLLDASGQRYRVVEWEKIVERSSKEARYMVYLRAEEQPRIDEAHCARLTKRERQILFLLASRATNREIAAAFGISVHTARHHTQNILAKLNLRSRADIRSWISGAAESSCE